jgi:hypothetical protein
VFGTEFQDGAHWSVNSSVSCARGDIWIDSFRGAIYVVLIDVAEKMISKDLI